MKNTVKFLLVFTMVVLLLTGCSGSGDQVKSGEKTPDYTIRVAHVCGQDSPYDYGADTFKKMVEERSQGRIAVEVYAGDMTTDDIEGTEMVQNGNLEIMWVGTGALSGYVSNLGVFELPFLFETPADVEAALTGKFGDTIIKEVSALEGIQALGFAEDGWRNILTKDIVINNVEDMKGVRMRSMMNDTCIAMYEALGSIPISTSSGEIYTSIQNGVVNGQDNSVIYAVADGYIEAINSICDIHHFYASGMVIASDVWFDGLSTDDQELIRTCAVEAGAAQRSYFLDADEKLIDEYEKKGYTVTRPTDIDAWVAAVQPVYEKMYKQHPEWKALVELVKNPQ